MSKRHRGAGSSRGRARPPPPRPGSAPGCSTIPITGVRVARTASWPRSSAEPATWLVASWMCCDGRRPRSFLADDSSANPDRASRKTRALQAAAHLAEDLHRLESRTDDEVAWVDGTRRNVRLRLSPIDVGPALGHEATAVGAGHIGADQRHHPSTDGRAGRAAGLPVRGARRRESLRLPAPTRSSTSPGTCPTDDRRRRRRRSTRSSSV